MAIGRPIELTPNIATKNISVVATADQTAFTVTGGYRVNEIAVYRNGVRLADGRDFTASDGLTVNLVTGCVVDDLIEFAVFDSFDIAGTIVSAASSQNLNGDFNVTGNLYAGTFNPTALTVGVATVSTALYVGSALTANAAGDVETIGIITASSFSGNITGNITGAASQITVADESSDTTCFPTFVTAATGDLAPKSGTNLTFNSSSGALTATSVAGNIVGGTGSFSGAVNVDDTTDSTSATSGSLIVDGGLGVAKNVYIGAGLSVAGTLTYEDVTNVDSVGMVTAKSGVNVSGGELNVGLGFSVGNVGVATALGVDVKSNLTVGSGITMGSAGVATFSGTSDVHLLDNVRLNVGDGSDLAIYHNGSSTFLENTTGDLLLRNTAGNEIKIQAVSGEQSIVANADTSVDIYYNGTKKFETTNDGTVTTGIGTFTNGVVIPDSKKLLFGNLAGGDCQIIHDGTDTFIQNKTGDLKIANNVAGDVGGDIIIQAMNSENSINCVHDAQVELSYNGTKKIETTNEGIEVTGFTSTTAGMGVTGGLFEGSFIKAGKLSDNQTLGISTANVFYFTTQETTTATPNIVWNDSYSLSSKMAVGEVASVTVITTAAAGGYSANWTIDGNAVTEEWVGGSAPSAGGSDGLDIYSLTIIKTGTGTGDSGWKVIGNLSNAT